MHMRLNPKKMKYFVVSLFRTIALNYCDFNLGGAELEEVMMLRILGVTFDCWLTFETHLRKVMSKAARAGKLFNCPRMVKICFNA